MRLSNWGMRRGVCWLPGQRGVVNTFGSLILQIIWCAEHLFTFLLQLLDIKGTR
jgi:hypothetical protein